MVAQVGSQTYGYDANGNMTSRAGGPSTGSGQATLTYDYENRLTQVVTSGGVTTVYTYDGDGKRVKKTVGGTTTYYVGNWYEVTGTTVTKYYYFGAQRVAMRSAGGVTYLHGDHLGSTSVTSGANSNAQTYYPYGSVRTTQGTIPTDYTFTGQKVDVSAGLMYYGARYYDAAIGRFVRPDSIIPDQSNPQSLNRYGYVRNNPVRYTDPTGHYIFEEDFEDPTQRSFTTRSGVQASTYFLSPGEARAIFGDSTPQRVSMATVVSASTRGNQRPRDQNKPPKPATVYSYGWLAGAFENFSAHGWDIVFNWETNEIGIFEWDARSPNGFVTPQAGLGSQILFVWNMNQVSDYAGKFDVTGGNVEYFTGEVFISKNREVWGSGGGVTASYPPGAIYNYSAKYFQKVEITVHPAIMEMLPYFIIKWGEKPPYFP